MDEREYFVRDYHGTTTIHPVGLLAMVVLGLLMIVLPRRYAVWPMIIMACFIPQAQRIVVFSLDFTALRILVVCGWTRLLLRNEIGGMAWNRLDLMLLLWATVRTVAVIVQGGGFPVILTQLGRGFDAIGMYFLFRFLIRSWDDVRSAIWALTIISLPVAAAFLFESSTARNVFSVFGGVSEVTGMRQGRLRCQGAFAHPILAGCFWASMLPLVAAQIRQKRGRLIVLASVAGICAIVVTCASSTPVMAVLFGLAGSAAFFVRRYMRLVRWGALIGLLGLAAVMNNPVWHLIARIHIVSGSTSWHRFKLIDEAINHWHEWFAIGSTKGAAHWGRGLFDVTNDYVVQALQGGILQLGLFVAIIVVGFKCVGRIWRAVEKDGEKLWLSWGLGVCLFTHALNFIAITYFGQIILVWFLTLAMIGSLTPKRVRKRVVQVSPADDRRSLRETALDGRLGWARQG